MTYWYEKRLYTFELTDSNEPDQAILLRLTVQIDQSIGSHAIIWPVEEASILLIVNSVSIFYEIVSWALFGC